MKLIILKKKVNKKALLVFLKKNNPIKLVKEGNRRYKDMKNNY
jgi:hypothetical protein